MQVGLSTSSLQTSTSSPLTRGSIDAPQSVRNRGVADTTALPASFPESPLISARPLRYNVQLNQQLTAVQQADSFLSQTESQLLQLRHSAAHASARPDTLRQQAKGLLNLLDNRAQISGNTVDRHFNVTLEGKSQVNFTLPDSDKLLQGGEAETLVFSLGGNKREMAAVTLPKNGSERQVVMHLNQGLGRFGVHARQDGNGSVSFSVDESRWARVSSHLSVRGEDKRFNTSFSALTPQVEPAIGDTLMQIAAQPERLRERGAEMLTALEQITFQRGKLRFQQERVRTRIEGMATPYEPQQALSVSQTLGEHLQNSGSQFSRLTQALSAQANVRLGTVKNLLG